MNERPKPGDDDPNHGEQWSPAQHDPAGEALEEEHRKSHDLAIPPFQPDDDHDDRTRKPAELTPERRREERGNRGPGEEPGFGQGA